jgi:hypothetical protein
MPNKFEHQIQFSSEVFTTWQHHFAFSGLQLHDALRFTVMQGKEARFLEAARASPTSSCRDYVTFFSCSLVRFQLTISPITRLLPYRSRSRPSRKPFAAAFGAFLPRFPMICGLLTGDLTCRLFGVIY